MYATTAGAFEEIPQVAQIAMNSTVTSEHQK